MCIPMKKFLALFLTLVFCISAAVTATAADYKPYTLTDEGEYGGTAYFEAAAMSTETFTFMDPEGYVYKETVSVLNLKPGSSVKVTNYFGCNAVELINGMYEYSPAWFDFSNGPVENLFMSRPLVFQFWGDDGTVYIKMGEKETAPAKPAATGFSDVAANAYYATAVKWAVDNGITAGTSPTTFSPNNTCTTAQILTFLWRANGSPEPSIQNPFADVKESDYFYKAAVWAYEKDMVNGQLFGGNTPCTRSSTVDYLWALAGRPAPSSTVDFSDVPVNVNFASAVAWAVEEGITAGTSATTFSPDATCTRGQIATFLYRGLAE